MQQKYVLKMLPSEAADSACIRQHIASAAACSPEVVTGFHILKKSLDARGRQPWVSMTVQAYISEPYAPRPAGAIHLPDVSKAPYKVIITGAGPAGLFAAIKLIEQGIQPIILERGKDVRARRRDLAILNKDGIVNSESNYCFGEGGAGTYSDGKLYTRSNKRGNITRILNLFVQYGAEEKILYEAHPHIGTNKLPQIVTAMRHAITGHGGIFLFEKKVVDFILDHDKITAVKTSDGDTYTGHAVILATGHSARDIFTLLHNKNILVEAKPFALGVRVEHPQSIIDSIQYYGRGAGVADPVSAPLLAAGLPPASYSLVQQVGGHGVFSFCMCPGGIIAPAATAAGELVVNGWSPSKRNNPYANSGMVVTCDRKDIAGLSEYREFLWQKKTTIESPLALMHFQQMVEVNTYNAGGGSFVAPAQRLVDFCSNTLSTSLPPCSYLPGLRSIDLQVAIPAFIHNSLQHAFAAFGKKMKGYYTNEAVVVATESRTSSPVRIPRNIITLTHPQITNLYPCGEGAGYAGGIVSAAMDGENVAEKIALKAGESSLSHAVRGMM